MVTAVSNIEQARMRKLNEMRRQGNGPSSRREGGFRAGQRRAPLSQNVRGADESHVSGYAPSNANQNNTDRIEQPRDERETYYQRGLGSARRNFENGETSQNSPIDNQAGPRRNSRAPRSRRAFDGDEMKQKEALQRRRESLKMRSSAASTGKVSAVGAAKANIKTTRQKIKAGSDIFKDSMVLAKAIINPVSFFSLLSKIDLLKDWTYMAALSAATFDDILIDVSQIGDIPVLGGLISWLCQIFMGSMYLLSANDGNGDMDRVKQQMLRRMGLLLISAVIEFIPAVAMIPSEIMVGVLIYGFVLAERQRRSDHVEKEKQAETGEEKVSRIDREDNEEPEMAKAA